MVGHPDDKARVDYNENACKDKTAGLEYFHIVFSFGLHGFCIFSIFYALHFDCDSYFPFDFLHRQDL